MANSHEYNQHYADLDLINSTPEDEALIRANRMARIKATLARKDSPLVQVDLATVEAKMFAIPGMAEAVAAKDHAKVSALLEAYQPVLRPTSESLRSYTRDLLDMEREYRAAGERFEP